MENSYQITNLKNGVLLFTITRAKKRNAVNFEVMEGLLKAIQEAKDPGVKALVITGDGEQAFCSGGDLSVFHGLKTADESYGMLSKMGEILYQLLVLPKLTIALMNGTAVGGGCEIASACDYRVAHKGVKAGFVQGKLAITTGWGGGTMLLEKLASGNAFKMLTEAKLYTADELMELGFVQYIYEGNHLEGLQTSIGSVIELDGEVLQSYKKMLIEKWTLGNIKGRIEQEIQQCSLLWEREAHHIQVQRFLENKK